MISHGDEFRNSHRRQPRSVYFALGPAIFVLCLLVASSSAQDSQDANGNSKAKSDSVEVHVYNLGVLDKSCLKWSDGCRQATGRGARIDHFHAVARGRPNFTQDLC